MNIIVTRLEKNITTLRYTEFLTSQLHDVMTETGSLQRLFVWPSENRKTGASYLRKKIAGYASSGRHLPPKQTVIMVRISS